MPSPARVGEIYHRAFVSGASTGLGRAFTEMLLEDGVSVWGTSRSMARLGDLEKKYPGRFFPIAFDLDDGDRAEKAFAATSTHAGGFDLVINNAGYGVFAAFSDTEFSLWQKQLEVMLVNTARISHAALREMLPKRHGALVNISSLAVEFNLPFQSAYNMAKAGLSALNESLILETQGSNIAILDVRPGDFRTDFDTSIVRPPQPANPRLERAWRAFEKMMRSGPAPKRAAADLRRALLRRRSGTVRTGRFFQAVFAPLIARLGSLGLRRRVQAHYFDVN